MQFREHRGNLEESIKTLVTIADRAALIKHLQEVCEEPLKVASIQIEPYSERRDNCTGWERTFIVIIKGWGIVGFTDSSS